MVDNKLQDKQKYDQKWLPKVKFSLSIMKKWDLFPAQRAALETAARCWSCEWGAGIYGDCKNLARDFPGRGVYACTPATALFGHVWRHSLIPYMGPYSIAINGISAAVAYRVRAYSSCLPFLAYLGESSPWLPTQHVNIYSCSTV